MNKTVIVIGFLASVLISIGAVFKLMHLPGGDQLFMSGFLSLLFLYFPLNSYLRYKMAKSTYEKWIFIIGIASSVIVGIAGIFKIFHLQGANTILLSGAGIFIFGFLPMYFFNRYRKLNS